MSSPIFELGDGGKTTHYDAGTTTSWDILYDTGVGISDMTAFMEEIPGKIAALQKDYSDSIMPYETAKTYSESNYDSLNCLKVNIDDPTEWTTLKGKYCCSAEIAIYYAAQYYQELLNSVDLVTPLLYQN